MLRVVLASRNAGKVREFARLLAASVLLDPLPVDVRLPPETGKTFRENAAIKAAASFRALGGAVAVLADDSGLEVAALGGAPGVHSARFAGESSDDRENVRLLLDRLDGVTRRDARFVCALSLYLPSSETPQGVRVIEAEGELTGSIGLAPRGAGGFGYDPVFRPVGWDRTLAEVTGEQKNALSHRAVAARTLLERLRTEGLL